MTDLTPEQTAELNERHRARMERKKAIIDAKIAGEDVVATAEENARQSLDPAFRLAELMRQAPRS